MRRSSFALWRLGEGLGAQNKSAKLGWEKCQFDGVHDSSVGDIRLVDLDPALKRDGFVVPP